MRYPSAFDYKVTCRRGHQDLFPISSIFIIESFVGNAIKHGREAWENDRNTGECEQIGGIRDPDTGERQWYRFFWDDSLDAVEEFLEKGIVSEELGVGICNSVARLRLIYGDKCEIRIYNRELSGAVVDITLNLQKTEAV
ncbi:MAG: hypothetical protein ACLTML_09595 [Blautia faecis]